MSPRKLLICFAFLFLFGTDSHAQFRYENVKLVRVVDGDTVRLDMEIEPGLWRVNHPCRLLGVDAPELNTDAGQKAKTALGEFLGPKSLVVEAKGRDAFGRLLIELLACEAPKVCENVSDWLVKSGHATVRK